MATITATGTLTKGGSFLLERQRPEDIFSPAELTDDQKLIGQTAEEFVNKEVLPLVKELEEKKPGLLASLVKKAGELGLLCPEVPEAYGGAGLDKISVTRLLEKTSVYGSFSGALGAHSGIGTIPILYFGTEEHKMGIHGSSTTPLFFENCKIPKENLLHEIGRGHVVAFNTLNSGRLTLGVACTGGAKNVLGLSAKYATERKAFGKSIGEFGLIREKLAEMAIRTLAAESMAYRAAGIIEAAIAAGSSAADKTLHMMKVLEEYAIESSILKVYGSEVLDYVVDEGVQIFGGYGFHEEYPVARAYRDSRINRIFEGTNEINRMVIIQMLMKRAMSGTLPLMAAGQKLQEEILAGPSLEEAPSGVLAEEERAVANAKKIFLQAAGGAVLKYRDKMAEEQELIGALANIVMEIYAMESTLLRTQKAVQARGEPAVSAMADATRVFLYDASDRLERDARRALAAVNEGDMLTPQLAVLRRFTRRTPVDTIALRRRVAAAVQAGDKYPFEGR